MRKTPRATGDLSTVARWLDELDTTTTTPKDETMTFDQLQKLAELMTSASDSTIVAAFRAAAVDASPAWAKAFNHVADVISGNKPPRSVFILKGNSKLPFAAFSTLPGITCPGAGDCLKWCYSFKAWRYPDAFARQCQNTWLIKKRPDLIAQAFNRLPNDITLRLYVDGDFDSSATFRLWMRLLAARPDVQAYGYSKSLDIVADNAALVPQNYTLNLSSGSRWDGSKIARELTAQQFVRGRFVAVPIGQKTDYTNPEYHRAVRAAASEAGLGKVFSCPGKCGTCTGAGHACGTRKPDGSHLVPLTIAIGIH